MRMNGTDWAYFDYTATTPPDMVVLEAYFQALQQEFANSSATYAPALAQRQVLENARTQFAQLIGAKPSEIVFTSGATESNNLAIKGAVDYHGVKKPRVITIQTEHKAVLDTVGILAKRGIATAFLPVQRNGLLDLNTLENALKTPATLVSVMAVNNETGVIQPIRAIADIVHQHHSKLHVDGAQALGKIPINVDDWQADAISFSGHKIYAPKGIGALYLRRLPKMRIQAQHHGGGQERGRRSGTTPIALIQAFVLATERIISQHPQNTAYIAQLAQQLIQNLPSGMTSNINLENTPHTPHILSIDTGKPVSVILRHANDAHIALSAGSACQAGSDEGSHVLNAMGLTEVANRSIRISLSSLTTPQEMNQLQEFLIGESKK